MDEHHELTDEDREDLRALTRELNQPGNKLTVPALVEDVDGAPAGVEDRSYPLGWTGAPGETYRLTDEDMEDDER